MEHHTITSRAEAERLLGIAENCLREKNFSGCRDFAILAQETEPLLEGSDQILAVAEVLLAAEKRLNNSQQDWYSILQIPQRTEETELIKKQYRRLALLLHPDKNNSPFSDSAFRLVADAWSVLSDPSKKSAYDSEFIARFTKVELVPNRKRQPPQQQKKQTKAQNSHQKLPVRRSARGGNGSPGYGGGSGSGSGSGDVSGGVKVNKKSSGINSGGLLGNFWTTCPYCFNLYEYPRVYEGCCLRCDNFSCKRAFTATEILSMPPTVPGKEAYYCCWGFFPMGFVAGNVDGARGFPKWMPPMFGDGGAAAVAEDVGVPPENMMAPPPPPPSAAPVAVAASAATGKKKRGRPRKTL